tara:strand:+ start:6680 stop:7342 length:663 start_codon:yes stop_codon:yes gene_type:complete
MAKALTIDVNQAQFRALKNTLAGFPGGLARGMPAAINKTTRSGKTKVARGIFGLINMKLGDIKKGIDTKKANRNKWIGEVNLIDTKRIPLIQFGARQLKRGGVKYKITRGGAAQTIGDDVFPVFIATVKNHKAHYDYDGHEGVFRTKKPRTDAHPPGWKDPKGKPSSGRKLLELKGPSPAVAFQEARPAMVKVEREMHQVFMRNLSSQVDRFLKEPKGKN